MSVSENDLVARAQGRIGTVLRGKYRLDSVLGIGGMAVVYAATHRNKKRFAVKMLHPELSIRPEVRIRFLRPIPAGKAPASGSSPSPLGSRCVPPFFFDDQGNRIFKKECL